MRGERDGRWGMGRERGRYEGRKRIAVYWQFLLLVSVYYEEKSNANE